MQRDWQRGVVRRSSPRMRERGEAVSPSVSWLFGFTVEEPLSPPVPRGNARMAEASVGATVIDRVLHGSPHSLRHLSRPSGGRALQLYMPIQLRCPAEL